MRACTVADRLTRFTVGWQSMIWRKVMVAVTDELSGLDPTGLSDCYAGYASTRWLENLGQNPSVKAFVHSKYLDSFIVSLTYGPRNFLSSLLFGFAR